LSLLNRDVQQLLAQPPVFRQGTQCQFVTLGDQNRRNAILRQMILKRQFQLGRPGLMCGLAFMRKPLQATELLEIITRAAGFPA
jgi:hypothetical protein